MKQAGPFLMLGAVALWLRAHFEELPLRIPVHWNAAGQADRYVSRTPLAAGFPLLLGAVACLITAFAQQALVKRSVLGEATGRILLATEYFIAFTCCGIFAAMASNGRYLTLALLGSLVFVLWLVLYSATSLRSLPREPVRNPQAWRAGIFYYDPEDPALFVPKRSGLGYTFNFGRPSAIVLTVALLLLPIAIALVALSGR